jgi:hypothetical protein
MDRSKPACFLGILCVVCTTAQSPATHAIAARITANALRADVSFLASDALEGRGTPSRGLDIAAEYIAAEFRRAGLEPAGDEAYFQNAAYEQVTPGAEPIELAIETARGPVRADGQSVIQWSGGAVSLAPAPCYMADLAGGAAAAQLKAEEVRGKVVIVKNPGFGSAMAAAMELSQRLAPALVVILREAAPGRIARPRLREAGATGAPILVVWDSAFRAALADAKTGPVDATVSAHVAASSAEPVKLRNVVGVLRGTSPTLRGTYILLTAHYDHLGIRGTGDGDHIFNGANDDASGSASVNEIAGALASLTPRPSRSIVFMALFGEELGELGSRYYVRHPIVLLARSVADINLEQLGRTDDRHGARVGQFNLTGFDFTDLASYFRKAGAHCLEPRQPEDRGVRRGAGRRRVAIIASGRPRSGMERDYNCVGTPAWRNSS